MNKSVILCSFLLLLFAGCEKQTPNTDNSAPVSTEQSALVAEQTFNDLNTFADDYFNTSGVKKASTCPVITWSLNALPFTITMDWGDGCTGADGVLRKGKITITLNARMSETNAMATFTFNKYYADGKMVTGVHKITYVGLNPVNNWPRYQIFTEARIDFPDNKFITYRAVYWRLLAEGSATATTTDDVWRIEGTSSGKTADGVSWEATTTRALVKAVSCRWYKGGILKVTPRDGTPVVIDFGDGVTCDNKATVTKDGKTETIELK